MAIDFPDSPNDGDIFDSGSARFIYNAAANAWQALSKDSTSIGDAAPSNPNPGDLWFDSTTAQLFVWYDDVSSSQWVNVTTNSSTQVFSDDGSFVFYPGPRNVGIGTATPDVSLSVFGNDAIQFPVGTTAERPTGAAGMVRYNSDDSALEYYTNEWVGLPKKDYFSAYDLVGNTNVTSVATVTIDTIFKNSDSSVFTLTSNEVTVNKTSTFMVTIDCTTDISSGVARSNSRAQLEIDTGSGFNTITGSLTWMYNRLDVNGEDTGSSTIIIDINAGDVLRITAQRTAGTDTIITKPQGSRITIVEL